MYIAALFIIVKKWALSSDERISTLWCSHIMKQHLSTKRDEVLMHTTMQKNLENIMLAQTAVAQWIEHQPANQRVTSSIPSQGTRLGCGPGPLWGAWHTRGNHTLMFLSLSLSLPPTLSKNK